MIRNAFFCSRNYDTMRFLGVIRAKYTWCRKNTKSRSAYQTPYLLKVKSSLCQWKCFISCFGIFAVWAFWTLSLSFWYSYAFCSKKNKFFYLLNLSPFEAWYSWQSSALSILPWRNKPTQLINVTETHTTPTKIFRFAAADWTTIL